MVSLNNAMFSQQDDASDSKMNKVKLMQMCSKGSCCYIDFTPDWAYSV